MAHPANVDLHVSDDCLDLIKEFEGWYPRAYYDGGGVLTIGWGTTNMGPNGKVVWEGRVITKAQGTEFLRKDMEYFEKAVKRLVTVPLSQNQFDALVSLCYNMGEGNLKKSPVLKAVNRSNFESVPALMLQHNKGKDKDTGKLRVWNGLTRRREAEGILFKGSAETRPISFGQIDGSNIMATGSSTKQNALIDTLKSETTQTQIVTWAGIMGTVAAAIEPITNNPLLFIGLVVAAVGLGLGFYIKYRDTKQWR
jgi:lysozyme